MGLEDASDKQESLEDAGENCSGLEGAGNKSESLENAGDKHKDVKGAGAESQNLEDAGEDGEQPGRLDDKQTALDGGCQPFLEGLGKAVLQQGGKSRRSSRVRPSLSLSSVLSAIILAIS